MDTKTFYPQLISFCIDQDLRQEYRLDSCPLFVSIYTSCIQMMRVAKVCVEDISSGTALDRFASFLEKKILCNIVVIIYSRARIVLGCVLYSSVLLARIGGMLMTSLMVSASYLWILEDEA